MASFSFRCKGTSDGNDAQIVAVFDRIMPEHGLTKDFVPVVGRAV
ncbi:hypothetical protein [Sinomonas gamaensis]|nr:hypothetical protein [Sinomonas gamaensis]